MDAAEFVRTHTALAPVPLVPEIRVHTASEVSSIWNELTSLPYWCAPWPGGQALARWLLDHPETVRGKRVLDFGTGSGIVAIAAMKAGAQSVVAVDVDRFAATACALNAEANGVDGGVRTVTADIVGVAQPDIDVMLAGDVWYEQEPARRFDAWFRALAIRILTGDPGRLYVPTDLQEIARFEVPASLDLENALVKTTRILEYP